MDKTDNINKAGIDSELNAVKALAIRYNLDNFSDSVLSSLLSEYEEEFKNEPLGPKEAPLTKRHEILRDRISLLKSMIKKRNEKQ